MQIDVNSNLQLFNLTFVVGDGIIYSESEGSKMPKLWNVDITDAATYFDVEAETKEEAILIALGWFSERQPTIFCEEVTEDAEVL